MNRREFLTTVSAATLAPALPAVVQPAVISVDLAKSPSVTMWAVGTWGEYDWQPVAAETEEEAIRLVADWDGMICPETGELEKSYDATRCKEWDDLPHDPTPGDWLRAGMGHTCDRCGFETASDDGQAVGDKAICNDCMTIEDWQLVDPEYAQELREEELAEAIWDSS